MRARSALSTERDAALGGPHLPVPDGVPPTRFSRVAAVSFYLAAVLFLAGVLVLIAAPDAEAHGEGVTTPFGDFFITDNLVRWGLGNGMTIAAERDDSCGPNIGNCQDIWVNPPNDETRLAPSNPDVEFQVNTRHQALGLIADGLTAGSGTCCVFWNNNETQQAADTNKTGFNITWAGDIPIKVFKYNIRTTSTDAGAGNIVVWFEFRTSAGVVLASRSETIACNSNNANFAFTHTFDAPALPATTRTFNVAVNTAGCTITGVEEQTLLWNQLAIFDRGNETNAIAYTTPALEFADYLRGRQGTLTTTSAFNVTGATTPVVKTTIPAGTSMLFTSGSCDTTALCALSSTVWPGGWTSSSPSGTGCSVNLTWLGPALGGSSGTRHIDAWRVRNDCPGAAELRLGGNIATTDHITPISGSNTSQGAMFANAWEFGGGDGTPLDGTEKPRVAYCQNCGVPAGGFITLAAAYQNASWGPMGTYPHPIAFDVDVDAIGTGNYDITNVSTAASTVTTNGVRTFTLTIPGDETTFGNAYYWSVYADNATATPNICPNTVTVNGISTPVFGRGTRGPSVELNEFGVQCLALVEDFTRSQSIAKNGAQNQYLSNFHPSQSYTVIADFPAAARAPNESPTGYTLRFVQEIDGRFAERISCLSGAFLCYGNVNTAGEVLAGDPQRTAWDFLTFQNSTEPDGARSILGDASITETTSGNSTATNSTGVGSMTTTGNTSRFIFQREGFRTEYANISHIPTGSVTINFSVEFTSNANKLPDLFCSPSNTTGYNCTLAQRDGDSDTQQCTVLDISTDTCDTGAGGGTGVQKRLGFGCGYDRATLLAVPGNVSYVAAAQGFNVLVPGELGSPSDVCESTTSPQRPLAAVPKSSPFPGFTLNVTISSPTHQGVQWSATWLTSNRTNLRPLGMKEGQAIWSMGDTCHFDATANPGASFSPPPGCRVIVRVSNITTVSQPGQPIGTTRVDFFWVDTDTPVGSAPGEVTPIEDSLVSLGAVIGATTEAGRMIWGILLFFAILLAFFFLSQRFLDDSPPAYVMGTASIVAFAVPAVSGLWPTWLLIFIGLAVVVVALPVIVGRGKK